MSSRASLPVLWLIASLWSIEVVSSVDQNEQSRRSPTEVSCWTDHDEVKNRDVRGKKLPFPPEALASAPVKQRLVTLKVCIDETGQVARSIIVASSGNKDVDRFYQDAVSNWKLKPVTRNGKAIRSVANVSVTWNVK